MARRFFAALNYLLVVLCPVILSQAGDSLASDQNSPQPSFDGKPATGRLLVADKDLQDPFFRHTVILLLDHGDQGTTGLIINRPTRLSISDLSAQFLRAGDADILFYGGPVQPMTFSMLVTTDQAEEGRSHVLENIFHVFGARRIITSIARLDPLDTVRIYSGFAGWAPGQLEFEIERGGWHVLPGDSTLIFSKQPEHLWNELTRQAEGHWI